MKRWLGYAAIFGSAVLFYLSTYFVKLGLDHESVSPLIYVHARFVMGALIFAPIFWWHRHAIVVGSFRQLYIRALTNSVAVAFFFLGVKFGSVTNANLLNMTYPAFVALLAPLLAGEAITRRDFGVIVLTLAGAFAVFYPSLSHWLLGDLWGLASGVVAGWAIVSLRILRQTDHTLTILAFVFVFGSIFFLPIYAVVAWPESSESFFYIALTAATGSAGQLLLTYGFRYVRAVEGSILSSSRILIALLAGYLVLGEGEGWYTAVGALLLLIAHIGNATRGYYIAKIAKKKAR